MASRRSIVNAYLTFIVTTMRKEREGLIKNAFKAKIEASPSHDITPLLPYNESDKVLSSFLESPEGAGSPSTLEEFSIDEKVKFLWWANRLLGWRAFTALEDDLWNLYLYEGMSIDSAVLKGASQDDPELTLSGVVDHGILVFKTRDSGPRSIISQAVIFF